MMGGLSLPRFRQYYWAALFVTARCWFAQTVLNPAVTLEAAILGSYAALSNLVFRGPKAHATMATSMKTIVMDLYICSQTLCFYQISPMLHYGEIHDFHTCRGCLTPACGPDL